MMNDAFIVTFRRGRVYPYNYVFSQEKASGPAGSGGVCKTERILTAFSCSQNLGTMKDIQIVTA